MSYLVNPTVVQQITIGGRNVTDNLTNWTASDSSANRQGCIITTGTVQLSTNPGSSLEDYDRNMFVRGDAVYLTMKGPYGVYTHPRGLLYVMTSAYNPETETIDITTGCRLAMYALNDDAEPLLSIVPIKLDPAQETFQACCAAFSANGQYVYQDNWGLVRVYNFWGSNASSWTSILGTTTTTVSPLAGGDAIPQSIKLSYQVPKDELSEDDKGKVEIVESESYYFINYPVVNYVRSPEDATEDNPDGDLDNIDNVDNPPVPPPAGGSDCGNTPDEPEELEEDESCTDGYELKQQPIYVPAKRRDRTTSTYDGPGGQLSLSHQEVFAPEFEANSQYFADKFTFCRASWGSRCNPNGSCPYEGLGLIKVGETFTYNYYGTGNELVTQVVEAWATRLSAATPSDWRSGIDRGVPQNFDNSFNTANQSLFRQSRVETSYERSKNVNIQTAITQVSMTSRGTGISVPGSIDAVNGITTKTIRRSTTISTLEVSPDIVNSPTTATEEKETLIGLATESYVNGFDDYVIETQLPIPIFFEEGDNLAVVEAMTEALVNTYGRYLYNFIRGDAFGLQIGESMVNGIQNYRPGMAFRYVDNSKNEIVVMKMDATVWGADLSSSGFVTNGMWSGFSNGTATVPNNLYGNATPSMDIPTGGGGGGGGGSTVIFPPTSPPPTDPDGNANQTGDTWQPDPSDPTILYVWDGTQWVLVPPIVDPDTPAAQPPTDLEVGDVWQNASGTLYIWDGTQWVESTNAGTGVVPPTTRPNGSPLQVGDTWVDDEGATYVWDGSDWDERAPIVDSTPPTDRPGDELEVGDTWIDGNGDIYIWDGTDWQSSGTNTPPNTPPSTRPDGSPLRVNDVWQNADGELYVWDGSTWVLDETSTPIGEPPPPVDPDVEGETVIDTGDIIEYIDVHWMFRLVAETPAENGIVPPPAEDTEFNIWRTMTTYVSGMIVGSGDLLSTEANGSIPFEYNGVLVIRGATVIDGDVFS